MKWEISVPYTLDMLNTPGKSVCVLVCVLVNVCVRCVLGVCVC